MPAIYISGRSPTVSFPCKKTLPPTTTASPLSAFSSQKNLLSSLNHSPVMITDNDVVEIVHNTPIGAGGHANIFEETLDGRSVIVKSYRLYEMGDVERTLRVGNQNSFFTLHDSHSTSEIPQRDCSMHPAIPSKHCPVSRCYFRARVPLVSRLQHHWIHGAERVP